ncbi:MAG: hypothetical protein Athens101426_355 [Parcubacteria group bacterium Athens1014_26]|nr:MAG: hypothetical protein Athens101426_355 [Parcubacteria group bacterium Athens1014_26]
MEETCKENRNVNNTEKNDDGKQFPESYLQQDV